MTRYDVNQYVNISRLILSMTDSKPIVVINPYRLQVPPRPFVEYIEAVENPGGIVRVIKLREGIYLNLHGRILEVRDEPNTSDTIYDGELSVAEILRAYPEYSVVPVARMPRRIKLREVKYTREWIEFRGRWAKKDLIITILHIPRLVKIAVV